MDNKLQKELDRILLEYEDKQQAGLIPVLQKTQDLYGYLPQDVMSYIAKRLGIKSSEVYGVATFYTQFRFVPVGKYIIRACHGTACHVGGAESITQVIADKLKIQPGETTKDMKFTLDKVACLGCCSLAPVVMINDDVYGRLTESKAGEILENY
jgi:NADH-quinone oxidoreductase subunit E